MMERFVGEGDFAASQAAQQVCGRAWFRGASVEPVQHGSGVVRRDELLVQWHQLGADAAGAVIEETGRSERVQRVQSR